MQTLRAEDVHLAVRRLRRHPGLTIASIAALACGIGAAVATWALLAAVLVNPLSVAAPERLFQVGEPRPGAAMAAPGYPYPVFQSIRDSGAFDGIAAGLPRDVLVEEGVNVPQRRQIYFANHDFFATLGIVAARGRTFTEDEDRRGAPPVAVISDHYWRSVLNADPNVLGRTVTIAGTPATVVGILPRGFRGLHLSEAPDIYLPLHAAGDIDRDLFRTLDPFGPSFSWIRIVGRLRPGETAATAAVRLNALDCMCGRGLTNGEVSPLFLTNVKTAAVPEFARAGTSHFTTLLSITVGLLLLVGCLTVGMLLLVRTEDRRDELAVCLALGAARSRLASSIAVEAAVLCALGAVLAVPVALWLCYGIRAFQLPGRIDIGRLDLTLAPSAWFAATGAALVVTCAIALVASFLAVGVAERSPFQSRGSAPPRVTGRAPRTALVAGQVAITLVLVAAAGLFIRSLLAALNLNPAVDTDRIITASIDLEQYGYTPERAAAFVDDLRARLMQNRVIEAVSIRQSLFSALANASVPIDGVSVELPSGLSYWSVDEDYFSTIGLPIISGRNLVRSDSANGSRVAVVSESLGRLIAKGGTPLGHRISEGTIASFRATSTGETPTYLEVIGVVPDLIIDVNTTEPLVVYQPLSQVSPRRVTAVALVLRADDDPVTAMREAMVTVRALDPRVTLERMRTLDEQIKEQMIPQRLGIHVLGTLGGIALLLTVLGTYVIAESLVIRRRREMSIRAALGAGGAHLRGLVLRDTACVVGLGLIAGLVLTVLGARLIRSLLYQVEPLDPMVLATVSAIIFALALIVSLRPALEATRLDLTRSLREE